jgi:hypothetical protein
MGGVAESLRKARLSEVQRLVTMSSPDRIFTAIPIAYGSALIAVAVRPFFLYVTSYNGHLKISRREIWSLYSAAVINQRMDYPQQKLFNR